MRLGWPELIIIVAVVLLLFGAAKLPELSRSVGRSLRIFKAETKGLLHDDDKDDASRSSQAPRAIDGAEERAAADRVVPPTGDGAVAAPASERAER